MKIETTIEITAEMTEAGARALFISGYDSSDNAWGGPSAAETANQVFRAMIAAQEDQKVSE